MNELIKRLIWESGGEVKTIKNGVGTYQSVSGVGIDIEKLIEKVVQCCAKVVVQGGYWNPAFGEKKQCTPSEIAFMIKNEFGVK